ncbi:hypothetical protein GCM10009628_27230 [Paeniglutamicibacter kerguelensis]
MFSTYLHTSTSCSELSRELVKSLLATARLLIQVWHRGPNLAKTWGAKVPDVGRVELRFGAGVVPRTARAAEPLEATLQNPWAGQWKVVVGRVAICVWCGG